MIYTAETIKTKRLKETEMKNNWENILDGETNGTIRRQRNLEDVSEWVLKIRKEWNEGVVGMVT